MFGLVNGSKVCSFWCLRLGLIWFAYWHAHWSLLPLFLGYFEGRLIVLSPPLHVYIIVVACLINEALNAC